MNTRFVLFLITIIAIVVVLVLVEQRRDNPWDSDVFFGTDQTMPVPNDFSPTKTT